MRSETCRVAGTKILSSLLFLAMAIPCLGQQQPLEVNFSNVSGEIYAVTPRQLRLVSADVMSISENGDSFLEAGLVGGITFTTPPFVSGSVAAGGTFDAGGEFYIFSPYDADVTSTFAAGTWKRHLLPDGTSNYLLMAQITGTMFFEGTIYDIHGLTVQISLNTGSGEFLGINNSSGGSTDATAVP
jgi:hypothetical protein